MTTTKKLPTMTEAKRMLAEIGFTIRKRDGEYRVCRKGEPEATAYYTNDLADALDTVCAVVNDHDRLRGTARIPLLPHLDAAVERFKVCIRTYRFFADWRAELADAWARGVYPRAVTPEDMSLLTAIRNTPALGHNWLNREAR